MSALLKKITVLVISLGALIAIVFLPVEEFFYRIRIRTEVQEPLKKELLLLAGRSLPEDVPVGALLLYNDSIVGTGFNTVSRDSVAYGHAEINAISAAIRKYGIERFFQLDRNKLELLTTLEPCQMCKGAIIEYRIKLVKFMKGKDFSYWFNENRWEMLYQFKKSSFGRSASQDSLFRLHKNYGE
jgi:tRNA(Arg) A34 adenosine deaminase TadA